MPKRRCRVLQKDVLSVASDCTGLNAAALALETLGVPFEEEWVSDSDAAVRSVLKRNFSPKAILADVRHVVPKHFGVDFYTAGYPCQSYSRLGRQEGLNSANGQVLLGVLKRICSERPRTFLLENVQDFQKFEQEFELTTNVLKAIKDHKTREPRYKLHAAVLNSLHYGVAQSRTRLYIVGVHAPQRSFQWPEPQAPVSLESMLDPQLHSAPAEWPTGKTELKNLLAYYKTLKEQGQPAKCSAIADIGMSAGWCRPTFSKGYSPCLTKGRCESNGYWSFSRQRKLHLTEYFRLQGIRPERIARPEGVAESRLRAMVGNSFTVPVIAQIADRLLFSAGLTSQPIAFDASAGQGGIKL